MNSRLIDNNICVYQRATKTITLDTILYYRHFLPTMLVTTNYINNLQLTNQIDLSLIAKHVLVYETIVLNKLYIYVVMFSPEIKKSVLYY